MIVAVLLALPLAARERKNFDKGWQFALDEKMTAEQAFKAEGWRVLDLPHDWAIEGDFHAGNPSGAGGGALPGGVGWYKKSFSIDDLSQEYLLEFDGVYMNSTVYVNGKEVGTRPYGYSSFEYNITPYLRKGENMVVVKVDNSDQPNSRWYSGCGIYRHVWLTKANKTRVAHWGTRVKTIPVTMGGKSWWCVDIYVTLASGSGNAEVRNTLLDADGKVIDKVQRGVWSTIRVENPTLWSIENPYVYTVRTEVLKGGKVVDTYETTTGFRDFKFDAETGFWLNGKNFKLNGVCEHHDLGCLGAAFSEDVLPQSSST